MPSSELGAMGSDSGPEPEPERASLLSGPAHFGLCVMETWRKRQKATIFLASQKFSHICRGWPPSEGWGTCMGRKAGGDYMSMSPPLNTEHAQWTMFPGLMPSLGLLSSCWAIQNKDLSNLILIICKVGTITAYLLRMWQRKRNWLQGMKSVLKAPCRTHAEVNRNACPFSRRVVIYVDEGKNSDIWTMMFITHCQIHLQTSARFAEPRG